MTTDREIPSTPAPTFKSMTGEAHQSGMIRDPPELAEKLTDINMAIASLQSKNAGLAGPLKFNPPPVFNGDRLHWPEFKFRPSGLCNYITQTFQGHWNWLKHNDPINHWDFEITRVKTIACKLSQHSFIT